MDMPYIDYPRFIEESEEELRKLEKRHRYSHLFCRVRMLALLKGEECSTIEEAAKSLGYSRRQAQRWFAAYKEGGMGAMLTSRVEERGRSELVSEEAFSKLEEAAKRGEIATIAQAHEFLAERGSGYSHPESVGGLLRRRKVKLKTGRPRHEKADEKAREGFKKSSPRG
jgi:transposase